MPWWMWLVGGLVLTGAELLTPGGFYLIFFGFSALLIGTLGLLGFPGPIWLQWLLFTALSVILLALFRTPLLRTMRSTDAPVDRLVGEIAVPAGDIPPGAVGRAELRGTVWVVRNAHTETLTPGQRCRVARVDGLMLFLVPE